jgi:hypothetical protein
MQFHPRELSFGRKHRREFAACSIHSALATTLTVRAVHKSYQALLCDEFFVPSLNLLCESLVRVYHRCNCVCASAQWICLRRLWLHVL